MLYQQKHESTCQFECHYPMRSFPLLDYFTCHIKTLWLQDEVSCTSLWNTVERIIQQVGNVPEHAFPSPRNPYFQWLTKLHSL